MVLVKMLMEIAPLPLRGALVMTMAMISPSRREVFPAEQLCRSPRLVPPRFCLVAAESRPKRLLIIFSHRKTSYSRRWASESQQGAHEVGGRALGGGAPHPRGQGVGPLVFIFGKDFSLFLTRCSVEFQDFWSCAE